MSLETPKEINGVATDRPVDAAGWLIVAKAIFGPLGAEGTSDLARTKLNLPGVDAPELAVGSSSASKKGRLRFGESRDGEKFGIWVPLNGVEPQPFLNQPIGWWEEGYGGLLFRTTAGVLRLGAQYMGALEGRAKEGEKGAKQLANFIFSSMAYPISNLLDDSSAEEAEDDEGQDLSEMASAVLGPGCSELEMFLYKYYAYRVWDRLSKVATEPY